MIADPRLAALARELLANAGQQVDLEATVDLEAMPEPARRKRGIPKLELITTGAPDRAPLRHRCPVGWCVPPTGESLDVPDTHTLCERHHRIVSAPMASALVRARAGRWPDLDKVVREATIEARRLDPHWAPWGVHVVESRRGRFWHPDQRGEVRRIEHFRDECRAICRVVNLDGPHVTATLIRTASGVRWTAAQTRAWVPHDVEDREGHVIGHGPTLTSAWSAAVARERETPRALRPMDARPVPHTASNLVTGETLTRAEVQEILRRLR